MIDNINNENTETKLSDKLFYKKKSAYELLNRAEIEEAYSYAKGYTQFLDEAKTERESVIAAIKMAEAAGFVPYTLGMPLEQGGRYYYNNRGRGLYVFTTGRRPVEEGIRILAAHIDSPRIDLKQVPVYEDSGMCFFKTHYYGGIRKYQWMALPLALHGVVVKADGTSVNIVVGENEGEPVFCINDLLPHLAQDQNTKPLGTAIAGETLNLLVGACPYGIEGEERIKLNLLKILNEKYGIAEADFMSAELCAVPAAKARDVGFDRALIGAYGHDDRVCAYPALTAVLKNANSEYPLMCVLADKEETGSNGNTGMKCRIFSDLIDEISRSLGGNPNIVRANSKCLSADVAAAYDPNFSDVYEKRNSAILSCGVAMSKYTGSRGKSGTSDASAEYVAYIRGIFEGEGVVFQTAELGKVDLGGGGTVAMYIANENIEIVDVGVPVLSMHAPFEVVSKVDLYAAYRAFAAFCRR
ncbi:MAG: aminopeptidase [Clostridiales bacterium]|nr:aminopeptidase [Clostridiales bacterium]